MNKIKTFYQETSHRSFLMTLLNGAFLIVASLAIFLVSFYPIKNATYKNDEIQMLADREELNQMSLDSKLSHKFENETYYTISNTYDFYLRMLLKYDYENSSYNLEEDPELYKENQETFKPFKMISVTQDGIDDEFVGYFYTQYIPNKVDLDGNLIIDFSIVDKNSYFYYEVLDIDGVGAEFFQTTQTEFPHLKPEIRKSLYSYNYLKTLNENDSKVDSKFFDYFLNIYNKAGEFLMKYNGYAELLTRHNDIFYKLQNFDILGIFVSLGASYLILFIIVPLFNKYKRNLGEIILGRAYLKFADDKAMVSIPSFIIRTIYGLIKYLFAAFVFVMFINIDIGFISLFYIGSFPVSLFSITLVSLLINAISLSIHMVKKEKNLENIVSGTRVFTIEKDYTTDE